MEVPYILIHAGQQRTVQELQFRGRSHTFLFMPPPAQITVPELSFNSEGVLHILIHTGLYVFIHLGKFRPISKLKYRGRSQKSWLTPTSKEPERQFRGITHTPLFTLASKEP